MDLVGCCAWPPCGFSRRSPFVPSKAVISAPLFPLVRQPNLATRLSRVKMPRVLVLRRGGKAKGTEPPQPGRPALAGLLWPAPRPPRTDPHVNSLFSQSREPAVPDRLQWLPPRLPVHWRAAACQEGVPWGLTPTCRGPQTAWLVTSQAQEPEREEGRGGFHRPKAQVPGGPSCLAGPFPRPGGTWGMGT